MDLKTVDWQLKDAKKDKYIFELKGRLKKLKSQRELLLKDLDKAEEKLERTIALYSKHFRSIVGFAQDENTSFTSLLNDLNNAFSEPDSLDRIEYILKKIHSLMLKEGPQAKPSGPQKESIFATVIKAFAPDYLDKFSQGYINIINNLKEVFDPIYVEKLNKIAARLDSAKNYKRIARARDDLFLLISQYISDSETEREKVANFIKDIVQRIVQIETELLKSYESTDETFKDNEEFGSLVNKEIVCLKKNMAVADHLDDLKAQISDTLSSIETALKEKTEKDQAIQEESKQTGAKFKVGFKKLKNELDQAVRHSKKLETKLNQDPLTGAFNRRAYEKKIKQELKRFLKYGTVFSIIILDIDHFKRVNDTFGHSIGDKCLQQITNKSIPVLRKTDMFARYGGEEFVVVMPDTLIKDALRVAEKIRRTIEKIEFVYKEDIIRMTVSIGVSQINEEETSYYKAFERADAALYKAKDGGRNKVLFE